MTEDTEFSYNAPRNYFDFNGPEPELGASFFFEENYELLQNPIPIPTVEERVTDDESSDDFFTTPNCSVSHSSLYHRGKLRKSLSVGHLPNALKSTEELSNGVKNENVKDNSRPHSSCSLRKFSSNDHINKLAEPKKGLSRGCSSSMTLAEEVLKFQIKTPKRFRTKPSPKHKAYALNLEVTVAQSPNLRTRQRIRPSSVISKAEQEILELEESKKFKIRAHPVSKKVLRGPLKVEFDKKPSTIVEPFKLTDISKKSASVETNKAPIFKAQPVPKSLHNPFKIVKTTPSKERRSKSLVETLPPPMINELRVNGGPAGKNPQVSSTTSELTALSFEERNKLTLQKRENFIEKCIREETKAWKFHAKPTPNHILRAHNSSGNKANGNDGQFSKSSKSSLNDPDLTQFKAKPATVLVQKPFEVKYDEHTIAVEPFHLSGEDRKEARHQFDEYIKRKELLCAQFKKEQEELQRKANDEAVARLRREMEHKAQPIRKYKELPIIPSAKITVPVSPNFHHIDSKNKENISHN